MQLFAPNSTGKENHVYLKGIVHAKIKHSCYFTHPQEIQDFFFVSRTLKSGSCNRFCFVF